MTADGPYVLTLSCPNRPGIVAAVAGCLAAGGADIRDARQFDDEETGLFFMRVAFARVPGAAPFDGTRARLGEVAARFGMAWQLREPGRVPRVLILVSRFDHCLADLLYRQRIGEIGMRVVGVAANYGPETYAGLDLGGAPFHFLPVTPATKPEQEARLAALADEGHADLIVLARYMQVLSAGLAERWAGRCINIHHSFLPGFKGARPYHQAHQRGVKLIGATAHYVTPDLDEGPIIAQEVAPVTHADGPEALVRKGRDVERRVLASAVRAHLDDRVFLNGRKTIVFGD